MLDGDFLEDLFLDGTMHNFCFLFPFKVNILHMDDWYQIGIKTLIAIRANSEKLHEVHQCHSGNAKVCWQRRGEMRTW